MTGGLIFGLHIYLEFRLKSFITFRDRSLRLPTVFDCTPSEVADLLGLNQKTIGKVYIQELY